MSQYSFKPKLDNAELYCPVFYTEISDVCVSFKVKSNNKTSKNSHHTLAVFLTILVVFDLPFAKTDHDVYAFNKVVVSRGPRQLF